MPKIKLIVSRISVEHTLILALIAVATIATYIRLYFSVEFTDESYYVALAYQYSLGAKPLVDDIDIVPFAILTVPFIKIYCWLVGSNNGIVLFTRHLYFVFNCLIAGLVFFALKNILKWSTALLVASICIVLIPFNIPNLSYNTLGSGFFTAGCFLGIWVLSNRKSPTYLFLSGLCHGLAVFSYPTLILPSFVYIALLIFVFSIRKIQALLAYLLGGLPLAFLLAKILLDAEISNVLISLNYVKALGYSVNYDKFAFIKALWNFYPYKIQVFFILTTLYIYVRRINPEVFANTLLFLPLIPLPIIYSGYIQSCGCIFSLGYLFYYSLLCPYFVLFVGQDKKLQELFYLGWIPSFVAGLVTAYTSGNGYVNAGLGMLSATVVTTVFLIKAFLKFASKDTSNSAFVSREIIAPFLVVLFLGLSQYHLFSFSNMVYRDADIPQLSSQIESGPFRGLYTTQNKKNYLDELSKDLKAVSRSGDRVLFYYSNFPAGYLLTSMRSAINTTFLVDYEQYNSEAGQFIENYLREQIKKYRVIAVKIQRVLLRDYSIGKLSDNDLISQIVEKAKASEVVAKENYSISVISRNES